MFGHLRFVWVQSISALVRVSEGDLRKAITFLQSAARLSVDGEISERTITEIAGVTQASDTGRTGLTVVQWLPPALPSDRSFPTR